MAFAVTNGGEKTQPSLSGKDHRHGDREEMGDGHQTEMNKVYEEMKDLLIPDLNLGIKAEVDTPPKSQDSVGSAGGKDEFHEAEVDIGKTTSVSSQTEVENLDGIRFTSKDHEEPKEQGNVQKCEEEDQEESGESALTRRSPEPLKSQPEASQSHESEAHVDVTAWEDGETSEAVMHVLGEQCPTLSADDLLVSHRELEQLSSQSPTVHKSDQEMPDEVLDPSMSQ